VVLSEDALRRFGLRFDPFDAGAAGRPFYVGPQQREALAFFERAFHSNDLLVLFTGERDSGTSATLDFALKQTLPTAVIARLGPLTGDVDDFLLAILRGFGFDGVNARREELQGLLTVFLGHQRRKGVTTVIVADNPEVVSGAIVEEVGWLSLLEPVRSGRMKLVMLGGDALERKLAAPRMVAFRQMIRWQHRLEPLGVEETRDYLDFQAEAAGCQRSASLFSPEAVARVHAFSSGLPGRINRVAALAITAAVEAGDTAIEGRHVQPGVANTPGEIRPKARQVASIDILLDMEPKARIRLNMARMLIGRHPWNDVQLDHDSVSRHHAMLVRESGHWTVVDLNSTNGIRVNERETRQQRLRPGDVVEIGRFRLVLNEGAGPVHNLPAAGDVSETTILRD
jgi:hypothetical protein